MFASTHLFSFNIINLKMIITVKTLDIFLIQETSKLQTMRMERYDILSFFPFIFFLSPLLPPPAFTASHQNRQNTREDETLY